MLAPIRPNDVLHLLPNEMVRLHDLTGFDEIFFQASPVSMSAELVDRSSLSLSQEEVPKLQAEEAELEVENPQTHVEVAKPQDAMTTSKTAQKVFVPVVIPSKKSQGSLPKSTPVPEKQDFIESVKRAWFK